MTAKTVFIDIGGDYIDAARIPDPAAYVAVIKANGLSLPFKEEWATYRDLPNADEVVIRYNDQRALHVPYNIYNDAAKYYETAFAFPSSRNVPRIWFADALSKYKVVTPYTKITRQKFLDAFNSGIRIRVDKDIQGVQFPLRTRDLKQQTESQAVDFLVARKYFDDLMDKADIPTGNLLRNLSFQNDRGERWDDQNAKEWALLPSAEAGYHLAGAHRTKDGAFDYSLTIESGPDAGTYSIPFSRTDASFRLLNIVRESMLSAITRQQRLAVA